MAGPMTGAPALEIVPLPDPPKSRVLTALRALATRRIPLEFERIPIDLGRASYRQIFNWLSLEMGIALRRKQPWGMPTHLQFEPSSRCNLRCAYCPVGTEEHATGHMDYETFCKVVDEVHRHALLLILWGWGEPFVCPSIYRMIEYAHQHGVRMASSTNGHLFVKREHAEALVASGLDALILSLSGTTQVSYERFRNGKLDTALEGTRQIVAAKRRLGSKTPHVQMSFIITDRSEAQVPEIRELGRELGVDGVSLKKLNTASVRPTQGPDRALPVLDEYRRFEYTDGDDGRVKVERNPCKHLWQNPAIRWDGSINPCAYDFEGIHPLGDVKESSFRSIWRGDAYRAMRERFRTSWESLPICSRCTYAYEGGNYDEVVADAWLYRPAGPSGGDAG